MFDVNNHELQVQFYCTVCRCKPITTCLTTRHDFRQVESFWGLYKVTNYGTSRRNDVDFHLAHRAGTFGTLVFQSKMKGETKTYLGYNKSLFFNFWRLAFQLNTSTRELPELSERNRTISIDEVKKQDDDCEGPELVSSYTLEKYPCWKQEKQFA